MDGERKASAHDIVFQARAGSPELNCCSVNGPRGLGILSEWGLMTTPEGPVVNYYGPGTMTSRLNSGNRLKIEQATDYPVGGRIKMTVSSEASEQFILRLRIPGWSAKTKVAVNGEEQAGMKPGSYLAIDRTWKPGDVITLDLDMGLQAWVGEREAAGKVSLYHGPLLLAYDPRFDAYDPTHLPQIDTTATPEVLSAGTKDGLSPILRLRLKTKDGKPVTLCDFASAGAAGNPYISWLPSSGLQPVKFDRENPLRTVMAR
jgi:DUF1680 family protein